MERWLELILCKTFYSHLIWCSKLSTTGFNNCSNSFLNDPQSGVFILPLEIWVNFLQLRPHQSKLVCSPYIEIIHQHNSISHLIFLVSPFFERFLSDTNSASFRRSSTIAWEPSHLLPLPPGFLPKNHFLWFIKLASIPYLSIPH